MREHAREVSAGPVREIRRAVADAGHVPSVLVGVSGAGEPAALRLPSEPDLGAAPGDDAWRQTITKRWTAVTGVSTSITQSTGMRTSNASPMPSSTIRSARSMSPPRAEKPSDSALARS